MGIIMTTRQTPDRHPSDNYPTEYELCLEALRATVGGFPMLHGRESMALDPGAGTGVWGRALRELSTDAIICGIDIRDLPQPHGYDPWLRRDFTDPEDPFHDRYRGAFDLVMGNPPYYVAEPFVRRSLDLLYSGGHLVFLLPLEFLASQGRGRGLYKEHPPYEVLTCVTRPSFYTNGKTNATDFAIYHWVKGYQRLPTLGWLDWMPGTRRTRARHGE